MTTLTDTEKECRCITLCAQDGDVDRSRCVLHSTKRGDQYRAQLRKDRYLERKDRAEEALRAAEIALLEWSQVTGFYDLGDRFKPVESRTLISLDDTIGRFARECKRHEEREVTFRHWPQEAEE